MGVVGQPLPKPLAQTPEELRELSRLAIEYVLARDELWRFPGELERRNSDKQERTHEYEGKLM